MRYCQVFPSNQLSLTESGYVEPLSPPMRDHKICFAEQRNETLNLMSLDYLVHDFEAMCRKLKPTSKRVLIDIGASLSFHLGGEEEDIQPIVTLLETYEKFGFNFDHIYGFEVEFAEPEDVYLEMLPEKYFPSYHWINVGECWAIVMVFQFDFIFRVRVHDDVLNSYFYVARPTSQA